jgi:hypothetical protein
MKIKEQFKKSSDKLQLAFVKYKTGIVLTREDLVVLINKTNGQPAQQMVRIYRILPYSWRKKKIQLDKFIENSDSCHHICYTH